MPIQRCQLNGKKGWRWGNEGTCYTYDPNSKASETKAKNKAKDQGIAIGEYFREVVERLRDIKKKLKDKWRS